MRSAVSEALELGAISADAIKQPALCRVRHRPPRLDLRDYPHLPASTVAATNPTDFLAPDDAAVMSEAAAEAPEILLRPHLKKLKLPTVLREHEKIARQCVEENVDHFRYLDRLIELELLDREARMIDPRIKAARFQAIKNLESFDFDATIKTQSVC